MKTNITTFALMAIITSSALAALKAPMPEFKNDKQLAEWRAGKASQATSQGYAKEEPAFYTGKPYVASSSSYAFKYRSYDPEIARWTSEDPSGFPDGANGSAYAPNPTNEFDLAGLMKWRFTGANSSNAAPNSFTAPVDIDGTSSSSYNIGGFGSNGKSTSLTLVVASGTTINGWFQSAIAEATGSITISINETSGEVSMTGLIQNSAIDSAITIGEIGSGYNVGFEDRQYVTQGTIAYNHGYKSGAAVEVGYEGAGLSVGVTVGSVDWSLPQSFGFSLNKEKYE